MGSQTKLNRKNCNMFVGFHQDEKCKLWTSDQLFGDPDVADVGYVNVEETTRSMCQVIGERDVAQFHEHPNYLIASKNGPIKITPNSRCQLKAPLFPSFTIGQNFTTKNVSLEEIVGTIAEQIEICRISSNFVASECSWHCVALCVDYQCRFDIRVYRRQRDEDGFVIEFNKLQGDSLIVSTLLKNCEHKLNLDDEEDHDDAQRPIGLSDFDPLSNSDYHVEVPTGEFRVAADCPPSVIPTIMDVKASLLGGMKFGSDASVTEAIQIYNNICDPGKLDDMDRDCIRQLLTLVSSGSMNWVSKRAVLVIAEMTAEEMICDVILSVQKSGVDSLKQIHHLTLLKSTFETIPIIKAACEIIRNLIKHRPSITDFSVLKVEDFASCS